jgi:hypothetical protein
MKTMEYMVWWRLSSVVMKSPQQLVDARWLAIIKMYGTLVLDLYHGQDISLCSK